MKNSTAHFLSAALFFSLWINAQAQSPVFTSPDITYDLSTAVYAGNGEELDVSSEETGPFTVQFNDDGTKLFLLGGQESTIIQYDLSVAYDISTGTYAGLTKEFYVGNESGNPRSFVFNDDGAKFFVVGGTDQFVYEYDLSTAYGVSTATYAGSSEGLDISADVTNAYDLAFNETGDVLVFLDFDGEAVVEYTLTTPYDVSTASYAGASAELSVSSQESQPLGMAFSPTGDQLFVSGRDRSIVSYTLATDFDVSSATYAGVGAELAIGEGENYPHDLVFDATGLQLSVVAATNDAVFSYQLVYETALDENSTATVVDIDANDGQGGANDVSITYALSGTDAGQFDISGTGALTFQSSPDYENPTDADTDNLYNVIVVASGLTLSTELHIQVEVQDVPDTPIFENDFFDVSTATYKGASEDFIVSNEESNPLGLSFNDDGSKLFVLGNQGDAIVSYSLTTPYDVSTASYDGAGAEFSVTNEESNPFGFTFHPDGSKLYVIGLTDQSIVPYSLTTPFDLSTASHDGTAAEFYVGNEESEPSDLTFNQDGSKLYVTGTVDNSVVEYDLATNYVVNTATHAGSAEELLVDGEDNPYGLSFNDNGERLFVIGGSQERIMEYFLTEPYDVSTAVYIGDNQALDLSDEDNEPVDFFFKGSTVYVLGVFGARVYEYELGAVVSYIENKTTTVIDIQANDGQGGDFDQGVTYALTGDDASFFTIDASGNINFNDPPDYETPLDEGGNNVYDFTIVADNGINSSELPFKIRVDDVVDVPVFETEFEGSYDVASGVYAGTDQDFIYDLTNYDRLNNFEFGPEGELLLIVDDANGVSEFELSVPYDVSSAEFTGFTTDFNLNEEPSDVEFALGGSKMFVVADGDIYEFSLTVPYDGSSAMATGNVFETSTANSPGEVSDIEFSTDGKTLLMHAYGSIFVNQYTLETAFDLSTASHAGKLTVGDNRFWKAGIALVEDGSSFHIGDISREQVISYSLPDPDNILTGQLRPTRLSIGNNLRPGSLEFALGGLKLFVGDLFAQRIQEYDLPAIVDYAENEEVAVIDVDTNDGVGGATDVNITYSLEGDDADLFSISASGQLTFLASPDYENPDDENEDNLYEVTIMASNAFNTISQRVNVVVEDIDDFPVLLNNLNNPFDLSSGIYEAESGTLEARTPVGLSFNNDGTSFFTIEWEHAYLRQYDLEAPYDVASAVYSGDDFRLDVSSEEPVPRDFTFSEDGTMLFVVGNEKRHVVGYELSEPFDLTTATAIAESNWIDVDGGVNLNSIEFNEDGLILLIAINDGIRKYALTDPYDIATATQAQDYRFNPRISRYGGFTISPGGEDFFVFDRTADKVLVYHTNTPFDLSGLTYSGSDRDFYVGDRETELYELTFNDTGSKFYIVGTDFDVVTAYDLNLEIAYDENRSETVIDINATAGFQEEVDELVEYTLSGLDAELFSIDEAGLITFNSVPDFESPDDSNENNTYRIIVGIDNGFHSIRQELGLAVQNVDDEDPAFTSATTVELVENLTDVSYTITTDETATYTLGTTLDEHLFTILNDDEIHFVDAPDFENPEDTDGDNDYLIEITAEDDAGNQSTMELTVSVTDEDEIDPTITSGQSITIEENASEIIYTATADETVTFSLGQNADEEYFLLTDEGELSFEEAPDFETPFGDDNSYEVEIIATDGAGNSATLTLTVEVTDVDEIAPTITSTASVEFTENESGVAYAAEADEAVTFTLGTTKDESLFEIEEEAISFILAPNFENPFDADEDNVYIIDVIATDAAGNVTTLEVTIAVTDVDEVAPGFESESAVEVIENIESVAYTVEVNETVTITLGESKDESLFSQEGFEISFVNSPDFENPDDADQDNVYELDITATDEAGNVSTLELLITVTDLDEEAPVFESAGEVAIDENAEGVVYSVTVNETSVVTLGTEKDEDLFKLEETELSFINSPDFESPLDNNEDNVYLVDLIATDDAGNQTTLELQVTVLDIDDSEFAITSSNQAFFEENTFGVVYTATANADVNYTLGNDLDESHFFLEIDQLSFLVLPDYENPLDLDGDNRYEIELTATNQEGLIRTKLITVEVLDVNEFQIAGDVNGDGVIGEGEIAGDVDGDGTIGEGEIAGDVNGDGEIGLGEIAGDVNGDGLINGGDGTRTEGTIEIAGDVSGDGTINNNEISGDVNGDKEIAGDEIAGDTDGDQVIGDNEIAGDTDGDQMIGDNELAGDVDGDGMIGDAEILGDTDGSGTIDDNEVAGDSNGDGTISDGEQLILSSGHDVVLTLYPNPVDEFLFIQLPPSINVKTAMVSDLAGRQVLSLDQWHTEVDVSTLLSGTYLLQLKTDGGLISRLFIKQ